MILEPKKIKSVTVPNFSHPIFQEVVGLDAVMVWAWIGKEFPDMRQNKREIKFIRVGNAVRTVGQLKQELTLNRGP